MSGRRTSSGGGLKLMVLLGTRPEAVKVAPIIVEARRQGVEVQVVSSGQHPQAMLEVFDEFGISPDADLGCFRPGQTLTDVHAAALAGFGEKMDAWMPEVVLVQGDTTSALAGAFAAFYRQIPVAHVEAGLRTNSLANPFPEEMNRRVIDQVSQFLFPPTREAAANLSAERARGADIVVTGNTVVDAARHVARSPQMGGLSSQAFAAWNNGFERKVLVTVHRRESWGAELDAIAEGIARAASRLPNAVFLVPLHPNPVVRSSFTRRLPSNVVIDDPLPYGPFIRVLAQSDLVLTDSGGVLEEATSFGKRVLVARRRTERPEAIGTGLATLVGTSTDAIDAAITASIGGVLTPGVPSLVFGDGKAARRIVTWLRWRFGYTNRRMLPFTPRTSRESAREIVLPDSAVLSPES